VGQNIDESLRAELLAMEQKDQALRFECNDKGRGDLVNCYAKIAQTVDEPNTKRLTESVRKSGMPTVGSVGADGFKAFMIVLQHSISDDLRKKCAKPIKKAFERKDLSAQDYANFVDRLRVHQGKLQLYGQNFDIKDGKMVMSAVKHPQNLNKRRAKIGLPKIEEYAKILREMYHLETVIPEQK
jgi:hypothetical protein